MAHSRFSPSATEREYQCPASFLLSEKFEDSQSSDAAHGTAAHHIGELCLTGGTDVDYYADLTVAVDKRGRCRFVEEDGFVGSDELPFVVDEEMVDNVQRYVDWCRELPGEHFVEVRVEHTKWCPDADENGEPIEPQFGTSDHNACIPAGCGRFEQSTLVITDLKYGRGVKVFAFENKQAIKYALGAVDEWNWLYAFERVLIRICQPRLGHFDTWELSVDELYAWGEKIKRRLELVFAEDPPFGPSEKACMFCKVLTCKARRDYIFAQRVMMLDEEMGEMEVDPNLLTNDELFEAFRLIPLVEIHLKKINSAVHRALNEGQEIGDLVLVESNTNREWSVSPETMQRKLNALGVAVDDMWKKTFFSPAQAEEALPKHAKHGGKKVTKKERAAIINEFTRKPPGYPVIAEPGDKRKRYVKPELDLDGLD